MNIHMENRCCTRGAFGIRPSTIKAQGRYLRAHLCSTLNISPSTHITLYHIRNLRRHMLEMASPSWHSREPQYNWESIDGFLDEVATGMCVALLGCNFQLLQLHFVVVCGGREEPSFSKPVKMIAALRGGRVFTNPRKLHCSLQCSLVCLSTHRPPPPPCAVASLPTCMSIDKGT